MQAIIKVIKEIIASIQKEFTNLRNSVFLGFFFYLRNQKYSGYERNLVATIFLQKNNLTLCQNTGIIFVDTMSEKYKEEGYAKRITGKNGSKERRDNKCL